jgi:hypothetical protein
MELVKPRWFGQRSRREDRERRASSLSLPCLDTRDGDSRPNNKCYSIRRAQRRAPSVTQTSSNSHVTGSCLWPQIVPDRMAKNARARSTLSGMSISMQNSIAIHTAVWLARCARTQAVPCTGVAAGGNAVPSGTRFTMIVTTPGAAWICCGWPSPKPGGKKA